MTQFQINVASTGSIGRQRLADGVAATIFLYEFPVTELVEVTKKGIDLETVSQCESKVVKAE